MQDSPNRMYISQYSSELQGFLGRLLSNKLGLILGIHSYWLALYGNNLRCFTNYVMYSVPLAPLVTVLGKMIDHIYTK